MQIEVGTGLAILGAAFAAWAWVVAWGVNIVKREVHELKNAAQNTANALESHILMTEKRLTMLEVEFSFLRRYMTHDKPEHLESP